MKRPGAGGHPLRAVIVSLGGLADEALFDALDGALHMKLSVQADRPARDAHAIFVFRSVGRRNDRAASDRERPRRRVRARLFAADRNRRRGGADADRQDRSAGDEVVQQIVASGLGVANHVGLLGRPMIKEADERPQ